MKTHARVVVIGGGVVGVSTLYHLAKKGWSDVTLLERTELTAGSTWHAAGLLPLFNMSYTVGQLHKYSVDLYKRLPEETGQDVSFHVTGNLRLATCRDRMDEYYKYCGTANTIGVPFRVISPGGSQGAVAAREPGRRRRHAEDRRRALPSRRRPHRAGRPHDGAARAARARPAPRSASRRKCKASTRTPSGEWKITTNEGDITCEHVVCATGNYARETGRKFGLSVPAIPGRAPVHRLRRIRRAQGLPQRGRPRARRAARIRRVVLSARRAAGLDSRPLRKGRAGALRRRRPARVRQGALPRRSRPAAAARRGGDEARAVPRALRHQDDRQRADLLHAGRQSADRSRRGGLRNVWLNEGHSFGVTAAGGAGWQLAEWIVEGEPGIDMLAVDPRRFGGYTGKRYTVRKNEETYRNVFTIHYPDEEREDARPAKTSAVYEKLNQMGAVWGQRYGWERANWFAPPGVRAQGQVELPAQQLLRARRQRMPADARKRGRDRPHAVHQARSDGPGRRGVARLAGREQGAGEAGPHRAVPRADEARRHPLRIHDHAPRRRAFLCRERRRRRALRQRLPAPDAAGRPERSSCATSPRAAARSSSPARRRATCWRSSPTRRSTTRASRGSPARRSMSGLATDVYALRVNFIGELGWELHFPIEYANGLFDALFAAGRDYGIGMVGMRAMESLRIEKSYRMWGSDLTPDYTPFEAGLDRFVRMEQGRVHRQGGARAATRGRRAASLRHARSPWRDRRRSARQRAAVRRRRARRAAPRPAATGTCSARAWRSPT